MQLAKSDSVPRCILIGIRDASRCHPSRTTGQTGPYHGGSTECNHVPYSAYREAFSQNQGAGCVGTVKLAGSRPGRRLVGWVNRPDDDASRSDLRRPSLPRRDHQLRGVAVFSVPVEPAHGRGDAARPRHLGDARDDPSMEPQFRPGIRRADPSASATPWRIPDPPQKRPSLGVTPYRGSLFYFISTGQSDGSFSPSRLVLGMGDISSIHFPVRRIQFPIRGAQIPLSGATGIDRQGVDLPRRFCDQNDFYRAESRKFPVPREQPGMSPRGCSATGC